MRYVFSLPCFPPLHRCVVGLLAAVALGLATPRAEAQPGDLGGFMFLRLEPSARASALGGSFNAVYGDDVNAFFFNPALLNEQAHTLLSVSYLNHLSDLNAGFIAYGRHIEPLETTFAGGLRFLSWGELERADENGNRMGTFGASDVALTFGASRAYTDRIRYGANVHAVFSRIDAYRASALAVDLGVLYRNPLQRFTLSLSVNNLGVTLNSLGTTTDDLPVDLRVAVTKRLRYLPLLISVTGYNLHDPGGGPEDATVLNDVMRHLAFGGEFQFSESFNVRFGYNHRRHEELKTKSRLDFAGVGVGFGIKITRIRFDYAFNSWSSLGGLHQFTLQTKI